MQELNIAFENGKIETEEYFNKINEQIDSINLSERTGEELEAFQAIFATTTEYVADAISDLNAGLESGSINFIDYSEGITNAAESMMELRKEQNNLWQDSEGNWRDAGNNIDEYANSLQNAIDKMNGMTEMMQTMGEYYDYIAEHANWAGEAAFKQADVSTQAYQNMANGFADALISMESTNKEAYDAITAKVFDSTNLIANEHENANDYIRRVVLNDAEATDEGLNEMATQLGENTTNVTSAMGNVLTELGNAIAGFKYELKAKPYISGGFGLHTNSLGIPDGLTLPTFGFNIEGNGGNSIGKLSTALSTFGTALSNVSSNQFKWTPTSKSIGSYNSSGTSSPSSGSSGSSNKGSGGSSKSSADDEYKNKLNAFKDFVNERERLEQRWVSKQKELGQLSTKDFLYITQQRIERYKVYLEEVKKATWMNAEDRLALEKEYSEKIEDLQVDYIGYLKDQLDEQIKDLKEANKKKIDLIEEEADARINALKKVENENDRIRRKEEYLKKRQQYQDDVSYWEQRTGREAQEALLEAKKKLQDLDEEWKEQLEDWSIDDQIKAIEDERDAQIKAIEETQEAQIAAWEAAYEARVKLFAETGTIIYDNAIIQSQALYNAYKSNFVDPLRADLASLNASSNSSGSNDYTAYTIQRGDTLSAIAKRYNTTVDKIMAANPNIKDKNKIYTGNTLKIPKFHDGGIVGGNQEGWALLKPHEVVLKPEWADSLNRMMKYFDNVTKGNTPNATTSTKIEVSGDLVRIDANIKNKGDAEYLTKKIEKMLESKFNIKK